MGVEAERHPVHHQHGLEEAPLAVWFELRHRGAGRSKKTLTVEPAAVVVPAFGAVLVTRGVDPAPRRPVLGPTARGRQSARRSFRSAAASGSPLSAGTVQRAGGGTFNGSGSTFARAGGIAATGVVGGGGGGGWSSFRIVTPGPTSTLTLWVGPPPASGAAEVLGS